MFARRAYEIIEKLQKSYSTEKEFAVELLNTIIKEFGKETHISGGRIWLKEEQGYKCIYETGTRHKVNENFIFPLEQIPLQEMLKERFVHLNKDDPRFNVPAQRALGVDSFTALPIDKDLKYIISVYFEEDKTFTKEKDIIADFLKIISLFCFHLSEKKKEDQFVSEIINLAREQQLSILPSKMPQFQGYDIYGKSIPYTVVGGDYFNFFPLFGPLLSIVIADVKGKGFNAAVQATALHRVLKVLSSTSMKIAYRAKLMNEAFYEEPFSENLIAMVYGELSPEGRFYYTNIAHIYPLWFKYDTKEILELSEGGPFLGLKRDSRYALGIIRLRKNDVLVLYTDGIVEVENPHGVQYSRERLKELISANHTISSKEMTELILEEGEKFSKNGSGITDDRTVIVVKRIF